MIAFSVKDHVAEVVITRPEKKNALNFEMLDGLIDTANQLRKTAGLRAVILRGAGDVFSAGIDTSLFQDFMVRMSEIKHQMRNPPEGEAANLFQKPNTIWQELPVPVIAALHGVCFGAGMQLALGCDFRIAAPDTKLSIMEAKWGLIPDMGLTQFLPRLMRIDQAKELFMTGRILEAAEAQALGLVTYVKDDPLEAARAMAADLAARSPDAIRASKALAEAAWAQNPEALALEAHLQADIMGAPNHVEAMMAGIQKRAPKFT